MFKQILLIIFLLFFTGLSFHAQINKPNPINEIVNAQLQWYEYPHESFGDTICFKLFKYEHVLGLDNPAFEFAQIHFYNQNQFKIEYWRWFTSGNSANGGTWNPIGPSKILLDFGNGNCKNEFEILSNSNGVLKAKIIPINE
ncbi:MAG: hypothetical protein IPM51_10025 [Sphingobacteriaceae bacterium]|nr:hypothetical protein [Sphingobacteriaceae bacterium]